jgi:hypothetical protein
MNPLASPLRLLGLLAALLLLALVVLLLLPDRLPTARQVRVQETAWALPAPVRVDSDKAVAAIQQRQLWGQAGATGLPTPGAAVPDKPLTAPDWRIAGVFTEGGRHALMLAVDGQPQTETLHVGDTLPGGAKVIAISNDRVGLSLNGQRVTLSTYPP